MKTKTATLHQRENRSRPLLVLLDGHSLAYRAFHALPPDLRTSKGEMTNATYGFTSMLITVLRDFAPDYMAVSFDVGRTFRHDLFEEYKAQRPETPENFHKQVERIKEIVEAFHIPIFVMEGYEADDVIGTLARRAEEQGLDVLIVTGDTDAFQLISPHVRVLTSGRRFSDTVIYDEERVRQRYGVSPRQLVDFKALVGDKSDNIPGVPGIGPKTAAKLLQQYETLEGIYEHLDEVKPERVRKALAEHKETVFAARNLVRIRTDLPLELDLERCKRQPYDRERVLALFRELEFRSLLNRLPEMQEPSPTPEGEPIQPSLFPPEHVESRPSKVHPKIVTTREGLRELVDVLASAPRITFDVETDSIDPHRARLVGLALAWGTRGDETAYIPVAHRNGVQLAWDDVRAALASHFARKDALYVAHNAKFDMIVLQRHGLEVTGRLADTMLMAWLIDPGRRRLGLKELAFTAFGEEMTEITELIGKGKKQITMDHVGIEEVARYAATDVWVTARLYDYYLPILNRHGVEHLFWEVEMPLVPVLIDMERRGVLIDVDFLRELSRRLTEKLREIEQEIYRLVGYEFNINSPQQLSDVLFGSLGLPATGLRKTKSGHYSTAASVLERLRGKHPVVDLVLEQRQLQKLLSTYINALPKMVNPETGRIHADFNQAGAETGRIASNSPNLQNIPIRTEMGRLIRKAFIAPPGHLLLAADYSQVELRILAHVTRDPTLIQAFMEGKDIHAHTASLVYGVPIEEVTPQMRRVAKMTNFAISYGVTGYGLAERTEMDRETANAFIAQYFRTYPKVKEYIERVKREVREKGYVQTLLGRRRYFPELREGSGVAAYVRQAAERAAINHPIQGTAADIIKMAMIRVHRQLHEAGLRAGMILQVHDELVLEVPNEELGRVVPLVRDAMENAYQLIVPLKVDMEVGPNWYDMERLEQVQGASTK